MPGATSIGPCASRARRRSRTFMPSSLRSRASCKFPLRMLLQKGNETAGGQDRADFGRKLRDAAHDAARSNRDAALFEVHRDFIVFRDAVDIALDDRQSVVDRVAEELASE